jgi:hypothetical protein
VIFVVTVWPPLSTSEICKKGLIHYNEDSSQVLAPVRTQSSSPSTPWIPLSLKEEFDKKREKKEEE